MRDFAFNQRTEENRSVCDPYDGDQDGDWPFQFRVFFAAGQAHRQRNDCQHQHGLPAPERERRQFVREQPYLAGALHHIVGSGEQTAHAEGKNDTVGMQGTQASV